MVVYHRSVCRNSLVFVRLVWYYNSGEKSGVCHGRISGDTVYFLSYLPEWSKI